MHGISGIMVKLIPEDSIVGKYCERYTLLLVYICKQADFIKGNSYYDCNSFYNDCICIQDF